MKNILLFLILLLLNEAISTAQSAMKYISLSAQDSTVSSSMVLQAPDSTYLFRTWQNGTNGPATTFIKTDLTGNPLGAYQLGGENFRTIKLCSDKGYIILGSSIIKTDSAFNILWAKKLSVLPTTPFNNNVLEKNGYNYMIATIANTSIDPALLTFQTYVTLIFKFDSAGNMVKSNVIADTTYSSMRYQFYFSDAAISDDGNLYLAYSMLSYWAAGTCNNEPTIIKLDTALNLKWANRYHVNIFNNVVGIKILHDNNLLLYGEYGSNYPFCNHYHHFVQKIDTAGTVLFAKDYHHSFAAEQETNSAAELEDGSLLFSRTFIDTVIGHKIPYFDHTDASGNILKSMAFDFPAAPNKYSLTILNSTNGIIPVSRQNYTDSLLFMTIDTALITPCGSRINNMIDSSITVNRNTFPASYLNYSFTFHDTVFAPMQSIPVNTYSACLTAALNEAGNENGFNIYPNPNRGSFTIVIKDSTEISQITIYNLIGEQINTSEIESKSLYQIDLKTSPGLYFMKIISGKKQFIRKLIIENE